MLPRIIMHGAQIMCTTVLYIMKVIGGLRSGPQGFRQQGLQLGATRRRTTLLPLKRIIRRGLWHELMPTTFSVYFQKQRQLPFIRRVLKDTNQSKLRNSKLRNICHSIYGIPVTNPKVQIHVQLTFTLYNRLITYTEILSRE
jgi:hypothetical protein